MQYCNMRNLAALPNQTAAIDLVEIIGRRARIVSNDMSLAHFVFRRGAVVRRHFHRLTVEVFIVLDGSAIFTVGAAEFVLKAGDVYRIDPGERHAFRADIAESVEFLAFSQPAHSDIDFVPEDL